jgi:hypothetical protein
MNRNVYILITNQCITILHFHNPLPKVYTLKLFDQFYPNNPLANQNSYPNHH